MVIFFKNGYMVITLVITIFFLGMVTFVKIAEAEKINSEEAKEIKTFLKLSNVPVFRNLDEEQLKKFLNKAIKPEIPDFTYGLLVLSAKDDLEWIDMILSQSFLDRNKDYFNSVLDKRLDLFLQWKKIGQDIYFFTSKKDSLGPLAGLASEIVVITNKTIEVFTVLEVWKTTETYKGIWRYFDERRNNYSHEEAWVYAKAEMGWATETKNRFSGSGNNKIDQVEAQLIVLWDKWGPYATPFGISQEYKNALNNELNTTLVTALENNVFAEEEQKPSLLNRIVQQFKKIKDTTIALTSRINLFKAGPIVKLPQQAELEEIIEVEPPSVEEPKLSEVEFQPIEELEMKEAEPPLLGENKTIEVELQPNEVQEVEEVLPEETPELKEAEITLPPLPSQVEPVPEPVFCERTSGNPTRFRIFINEVAWMGTENSSNNEWIELKNVWSMSINLSGWQLLDKDQQIKIIFSEEDVIPANGFYLLERTDDNTLSNITADFIYTGALNNTDEALYLFDANCQLEDEVVANPNWPAGDNIGKRSMERFDPLNWYTSNSAGTAKAENSPPPIPSSSPVPEPKPELELESEPMPQSEEPLLTVLINEIAWMGTAASAQDEWIELYNNTNSAIDITDWQLISNDASPSITFPTSTIEAYGFYLLERMDDATVSDILADLIYTGVLNNSGEKLELKDSDGNIIDIVDCSSGEWFAGDNIAKQTMERIDADNWASNNRVPWDGWQGKDADGNRINGTPKSKNSVVKTLTTITPGIFSIDTNFTLTLLGNPYFMEGSINVASGVKLTIEPGVMIKFKHSEYSKSELKVEGELVAIGTETEKIIFTSSSANPLVGDWEWLYFENSSSTLKNVTIQYAGRKEGNPPESPFFTRGAVYIEGGNVQIKNSTIEQSKTLGIWLKDSSSSVIDNVTFSNIEGDLEKPGTVYVESGSPTIKNSNFNNGNIGIWIESNAAPLVQNNDFQNNTIAIKTLNLASSFSGNTAQNNSLNGILVSGFGFSDSVNEINWQKTSLPYVFESYITITSDQTLNIKPGAIIKFKTSSRIYVDGTLKAEGTESEKIILTSFNDDEYGGDTNNNGTGIAPYAGYWDFISFSASSINSILDNIVIRYGGWYKQSFKKGAVEIDSSTVVVSNSLFENNLIAGLEVNNSTTTITNTTFKNHQAQYGYSGERSRGIWLKNAMPVFTNTVLNNNYYGIYVESGDCPDLAGVSFEEGENTNSIDIYPSTCNGG